MLALMALAALATLVGATLQSATGFGFALLLGPVLFGVLEPAKALTALLLLGAALNLLMLFGERWPRRIRWAEVLVLLTAATPGLVAGALVLRAVSKPTLQVGVGIGILLAALFQTGTCRTGPPAPPARLRSPLAAGVGVVAGALTTTTSINGPPLVIWFQRRAAAPDELRDSVTAAFLALNVLGALTLGLLGEQRLSFDLGTMSLLLLITAAGHLIGRRVFQRLDAQRFRTTGLVLVAFAGIASVVAGATA